MVGQLCCLGQNQFFSRLELPHAPTNQPKQKTNIHLCKTRITCTPHFLYSQIVPVVPSVVICQEWHILLPCFFFAGRNVLGPKVCFTRSRFHWIHGHAKMARQLLYFSYPAQSSCKSTVLHEPKDKKVGVSLQVHYLHLSRSNAVIM